MKNKKKAFIISGIAVALVAVVVVIAVTASTNTPQIVKTSPKTVEPTVAVSDEIVAEAPENEVTERDNETLAVIADDGNALTLPQEAMPVSSGGSSSAVQGKAGKTATPITPKTPKDNGNSDSKGLGSSSSMNTGEYSCGVAGHHCDGPETHSYILNLELQGCPYCGSNSCKSFYATDEWGYTCYDPSVCPKYDIHSDSVYYCQECGKACGDGSNGTCVQFVEACQCPNCGEWVNGNTCHTCK